ncbi:GNAT family acetyltransferase [Streptomyces davaonensis JCM 4913]|uniref:GNAT family acetyltransferase n=1 Tax=Streptomyces davaonensis (strain DSM 101723 / JCM 4913 / KCC S-0913 / 768) TaxID=1214101 RepID=K4RC96_STRDJ|nr:GNAT family N-acetyltransferase [Streptomyces davaonensis]CCK31203.1 GNAT family acetyltransferase [Streptomyces davaonensis JCM 4913]
MTVMVREIKPEVRADLEGFAHVRHSALPFYVITPDSLAYDVAHFHPDARYRPLLAEEDGEIIGSAQVGLLHETPTPVQGFINVYVHPDRTRRGAATLLVRAAEEYLAGLGATRLLAWVLDEPGNRAFAEAHGYTAGRSSHFQRLDLANGTLPPLQDLPPGVELRPAADFADDPRPIFELDAETTADEPSEAGSAELADYEGWLENTWRHPLNNLDLTTIALVDGRPAAFTAARTDGGTRYTTGMTGTARAFRGRGLAKLAKNDSLHRARAAGYTEAFTGNDTGNEPMLAINKWFGYEICATEVRYVRELG